jgi:hypothetical protein
MGRMAAAAVKINAGQTGEGPDHLQSGFIAAGEDKNLDHWCGGLCGSHNRTGPTMGDAGNMT